MDCFRPCLSPKVRAVPQKEPRIINLASCRSGPHVAAPLENLPTRTKYLQTKIKTGAACHVPTLLPGCGLVTHLLLRCSSVFPPGAPFCDSGRRCICGLACNPGRRRLL